MSNRRLHRMLALVAGLLAATVAAAPAVASPRAPVLSHRPVLHAAAATSTETSSNWAGYVTTGGSFSNVTATWVQPTVTCTPGVVSYSSFWVGLGGYGDGSQALEQIGTDADCTGSGRPVHSAWWEIVP